MADVLLYKQHLGFGYQTVLPDNCYVKIENGCQLCVYQAVVEPWSGDGLPPVGIECEIKHETLGWTRCEIVAHKHMGIGKPHAIAWIDGNTLDQSQGIRFRPIRTPEQIAADQYEKDAKEIAKILSDLDGADNIFVAKTLLDCGYRKFEITDDSDPA